MHMVPQESSQISDKKYEHLKVILVLLLQSHISIYNYVLWSLFSFFWHKEPGFFSHIKIDKLYIISNLVTVSQTLLNFYMSDSVRQRPQIALATVKDWVLGTFHQCYIIPVTVKTRYKNHFHEFLRIHVFIRN